jgi:hypothetical protein
MRRTSFRPYKSGGAEMTIKHVAPAAMLLSPGIGQMSDEGGTEMYCSIIRSCTKLVLAVCLPYFFAGASARPAQASIFDESNKCESFGRVINVSGGYGGISISAAIQPNDFCFYIEGDGGRIDSMEAKFELGRPVQWEPLCNWRIDWVIHYNNKTWWRDNGPPKAICSNFLGSRIRGAGSAPIGSRFCAELVYFPLETKISEACLDITR